MGLFKATRREELPNQNWLLLRCSSLSPSPGQERIPTSSAQQGVSMKLPMKLEAFLVDQTNDDHTATVLNSSSFNGL